MRTSEVLPRPELIRSSKIGAYELKSAMKINTIKGFLLTNATAVTLAVGLLFAGVFANETVVPNHNINYHPIDWVDIGSVDEPINVEPIDIDNNKIFSAVTQFISGNPLPIPTAEITDLEYADLNQIDVSLSNSKGTLVDAKNIERYIDDNPSKTNSPNNESESSSIPDEKEFIAYSRDPDVDFSSLNAAIVYPEIAQKIGAEGKVTISVLIDEKGNVIKTNIKTTSNNMFNNAAIDAVKKAVFTPALQGDKAVKSWLTIPIVFKLK